jgi:penicillin-binding protein 1A
MSSRLPHLGKLEYETPATPGVFRAPLLLLPRQEPDVQRRLWLTRAAWIVAILASLATGVVVQQLWVLRADIEALAEHLNIDTGPQSTLVYDTNDQLVTALFEEHRIGVPLDRISPHVVSALIAIEDKRFYEHHGLDYRRIVKAALANSRAGEIVQGGSTITQQLVRSLLLTRRQTYSRKLKEAVLALRLEEHYSKPQILEAYLNRIYFGDGYYGIEAAALGYFGKPAAALDAVEAATLVGLIKGPSLYSPSKAPERALERRNLVLSEMQADGDLTAPQLRDALARPLATRAKDRDRHNPRRSREAGYFRDAISRELLERFGAEAVYTGGLRVYTTFDPKLQALAEEAIASRLRTIPPAADVREPLQGALVAIEPRTGYVRAIVGGRDYDESPFNRALDARRQPGSAFKPFIYAQALESGLLPSSQLEHLDEPIETQDGPWLPAGEHERSTVRLRDALALSSNRAAAHLLQDIGVRRTLDLVARFGISSPMPTVPSVALGTGEMTLYELTSAYGVFANRGVWRAPTVIRRVEDRAGHQIYNSQSSERQVISEATAYLMTSMMADVINQGTATTARSAGYLKKAAGKTGTSNDYTDAWFVGYTPQIVTGVWFGYDTPHTIMRRGFAGVVAVPAWARFMIAATSGSRDEWFQRPGSLVPVKLCRISGLLATDRCHLPVIESVLENPGDPNTGVQTIVQEGGVYEDLRYAGRMPEVCPLQHGDYRDATAFGSDVVPLSAPAPAPPVDVEYSVLPRRVPDPNLRMPDAPAPPPPPAEPRVMRPAAPVPAAPVDVPRPAPPQPAEPRVMRPPAPQPEEPRVMRPPSPEPEVANPLIPGQNVSRSAPIPPRRPPGP